MMEETFAKATNAWVRLNYPGELNSDFQIRNWGQQTNENAIPDAMRNDLRASNSGYSSEQINTMVIAEMFNIFATSVNPYSRTYVPNAMRVCYGESNTFLIPEYAAYRDRGDALLRHQWDYMASIVPYKLLPQMTYDYFRGQFKRIYTSCALYADDPGNTILYWVNYDYERQAKARIARQKPEDVRYSYLPREDEGRLNRVFQEIDPSFKPVRTCYTAPAPSLPIPQQPNYAYRCESY
jgi:hypothetical protein